MKWAFRLKRCRKFEPKRFDFPDVPPQVPGGTIDAGEAPMAAAIRKFVEETGLPAPAEMSFLMFDAHAFDRDGQSHQVNRHYFHTTLPDDLPDTWDHHEPHAHDGAAPILFRFSWVGLQDAPDILGLGMGAALPGLKAHLSGPL